MRLTAFPSARTSAPGVVINAGRRFVEHLVLAVNAWSLTHARWEGCEVGVCEAGGWRGRMVEPAGDSRLFLDWTSIIPLLFLYFSALFPVQRGHFPGGTSALATNIPTSFSNPFTCCHTRMKIRAPSRGM